jgi:hypothetical protein
MFVFALAFQIGLIVLLVVAWRKESNPPDA